MGITKSSKTNTKKISSKFSISIDLCKENNYGLHLYGVYHQSYNDDKTYIRLCKAAKNAVTRYFPKNITTLEETYCKRKDQAGRVIAFDTIVRLPKLMNTVEKRKFAYDNDGPVFQMANELVDEIEKIFLMPVVVKDWKCGDYFHNGQ